MGNTSAAHIINLGSVSRIPMGQGRCYVVGSEEIAIFRQRDGQLFAVQNRCPHRQGPLSEGVVGGGRVICPLHGHRFDLQNGAGSEPEECVRVYAVKNVEGEILLRLGEPFLTVADALRGRTPAESATNRGQEA